LFYSLILQPCKCFYRIKKNPSKSKKYWNK
jgi:hypothetical protein